MAVTMHRKSIRSNSKSFIYTVRVHNHEAENDYEINDAGFLNPTTNATKQTIEIDMGV